MTVYNIISMKLQDQKEQVKASSKQFTSIFDFLEKTLLRGRVEKRKKLKQQERLMKGTASNVMESRQTQRQVILLTDEQH